MDKCGTGLKDKKIYNKKGKRLKIRGDRYVKKKRFTGNTESIKK